MTGYRRCSETRSLSSQQGCTHWSSQSPVRGLELQTELQLSSVRFLCRVPAWIVKRSPPDVARDLFIYYFASAAVAVDSDHMTASSSTSWSIESVHLQILLMGTCRQCGFRVCRWPQSQEGDRMRPHLCKLALRKRFISDHVWRGRWKPGCRMVGSVTIVWLTTEADDQSLVMICYYWVDCTADGAGTDTTDLVLTDDGRGEL